VRACACVAHPLSRVLALQPQQQQPQVVPLRLVVGGVLQHLLAAPQQLLDRRLLLVQLVEGGREGEEVRGQRSTRKSPDLLVAVDDDDDDDDDDTDDYRVRLVHHGVGDFAASCPTAVERTGRKSPFCSPMGR